MTALERYVDLAAQYDAARASDDHEAAVALAQQMAAQWRQLSSREQSMLHDSRGRR